MDCILSSFYIRNNYIKGHYQIQYRVMNLAMLARHLTSEKALFNQWLDDCLTRAATLFCAQYPRGEVMHKPENYPPCYDSSSEPIIPRAFFFEPDFDYKTAKVDKLLGQFIGNLDHSDSVFFFTADELLKKGFAGKPYCYPPQ